MRQNRLLMAPPSGLPTPLWDVPDCGHGGIDGTRLCQCAHHCWWPKAKKQLCSPRGDLGLGGVRGACHTQRLWKKCNGPGSARSTCRPVTIATARPGSARSSCTPRLCQVTCTPASRTIAIIIAIATVVPNMVMRVMMLWTKIMKTVVDRSMEMTKN